MRTCWQLPSYHQVPGNDPNSRGTDSSNIFTLRVSSNLDTLWTNIYGGAGMDESFSVIQTADSGFAIAAFEKSFGGDSAKVYMIKTRPDGYSYCNQSAVVPLLGNPVFSTLDANLVIDSGGFQVNVYNLQAVALVVNDSSLCIPDGMAVTPLQPATIEVYPNPVLQSATIDFFGSNPSAQTIFELTDVLGRHIKTIRLTASKTRFEISGLPAGAYFYQIGNTNQLYKAGTLFILN